MDFDAGIYSFYGAFELTVLSGNVLISNIKVNEGFKYSFYIPLHTLPISIASNQKFTLKLNSLPVDNISNYIFESDLKSSSGNENEYTKIDTTIYYIKGDFGPSYTPELLQKVDDIINSQNKKIVVCGNKGTGKSTFSKFLINKMKESSKKVSFVDLDPGQPEISLPTNVSLNNDCPYLFNSSENNARIATSQYCVLTNYISKEYTNGIQALLNKITPDSDFIVFNSFGWIEKEGFKFHQSLLQIINPDVIIVLYQGNDKPPSISPKQCEFKVNSKKNQINYSPQELAGIRFYHYFTRGIGPIFQQKPIKIPIKLVRFVFNQDVDLNNLMSQIIHILCGSIVSLCNDLKKYEKSQYLFTIAHPHVMECHGFGFIRYIDIKDQVIYLISPVNLVIENNLLFDSENKHPINSLVYINIKPPKSFYLENNRFSTSYTYPNSDYLFHMP